MTKIQPAPGITTLLICTGMLILAAYFTFAAVQGDYGIFRRVQIEAEIDLLKVERDALHAELDRMRNKTRRLSDDYLDLQLLDQQARRVLGLMRQDEIIIN